MACATLKRCLNRDPLEDCPTKRRRCDPISLPGNSGSLTCSSKDVSTSIDVLKSSQRRIINEINEPIAPNKKQKQLTTGTPHSIEESELSCSKMDPGDMYRLKSPLNLNQHPEKALFTFKQVQLISEDIIKEFENQLRDYYESVITSKLNEQYDAFVKFTFKQIQFRYKARPNYLS